VPLDVAAERQRGHVPLDTCAIMNQVHPIGNEVVFTLSMGVVGLIESSFPRVRSIAFDRGVGLVAGHFLDTRVVPLRIAED